MSTPFFLPTLRGDLLWCQGFSEPTAGSDLAALRTRAERVPEGYRIDGHKIWTSWAKWSTHCFFLARTGTPGLLMLRGDSVDNGGEGSESVSTDRNPY